MVASDVIWDGRDGRNTDPNSNQIKCFAPPQSILSGKGIDGCPCRPCRPERRRAQALAKFVFCGGERWARLCAAKLAATPECELCPPDARRAVTCVGHNRPVTDEADPGAWQWGN